MQNTFWRKRTVSSRSFTVFDQKRGERLTHTFKSIETSTGWIHNKLDTHTHRSVPACCSIHVLMQKIKLKVERKRIQSTRDLFIRTLSALTPRRERAEQKRMFQCTNFVGYDILSAYTVFSCVFTYFRYKIRCCRWIEFSPSCYVVWAITLKRHKKFYSLNNFFSYYYYMWR